MTKRIVRSKQSRKQHLFSRIYEDCPPETPTQLYINTALDAVGEEYGAFLDALDEDTAQTVVNTITTAAYAALEAARVSDDWRDVVKPATTTTKPSQRQEQPKLSAQWEQSVLTNPVHLYQAMAWEFQAREHPELLDNCDSDEKLSELMDIIDAMLKFALTAAGADTGWHRLYETVKAKVNNQK